MKEILIVEDESRVAAFLQKGLRKNGYFTIVAEDGEKAIEMASSQNFDLMLLDLGLPIKDGFTVLQELRNSQIKFPVIVVTARSDEEDKVKAMNSGANDFITKPFPFQYLLSRIKEHLIVKN